MRSRRRATATLALFDAFYRSGALVFGGGHVVLPLLQNAVVAPGWVCDDTFLAGYGAAQAVPGPLFTFAAYLGAAAGIPPGGVAGAALALVAIFLPGLLCLMGTLPFWHALRARPAAQAAMRGINAAVVGLLAAALYNPVGPARFKVRRISRSRPRLRRFWSSGARRRSLSSCWGRRRGSRSAFWEGSRPKDNFWKSGVFLPKGLICGIISNSAALTTPEVLLA